MDNKSCQVEALVSDANGVQIVDAMIKEVEEDYKNGKIISYLADEHILVLNKVKSRLTQ